ncbi:uncharacterized protein LOC127810085 [Diospyros lotus]|uniref:uncharacterized protein LOC127810085 n=1 Tax=Diospyros lotus TaxID=55363 RepID=UPI002258616B|nr:uncharacterized protein LOC127810085 [Diospyros lotus]
METDEQEMKETSMSAPKGEVLLPYYLHGSSLRQEAGEAEILEEHVADIQALMPQLRRSDYYTVLERRNRGGSSNGTRKTTIVVDGNGDKLTFCAMAVGRKRLWRFGFWIWFRWTNTDDLCCLSSLPHLRCQFNCINFPHHCKRLLVTIHRYLFNTCIQSKS